ncbi:helix-turn-helix domain-containing protein [Streptomyces sp. NPDC055078]
MLNEMAFCGKDVPARDRFDYWRELIGRTHAPSEMTSDHASDFDAKLRMFDLGATRAWTATFQPMRFHRTPQLIRRSDPELCHVTLVLRGVVGVSQGGRQAVCGNGHDLFALDTSRDYVCQVLDPGRPMTGVSLEVPKKLLHVPARALDALPRLRLSDQNGVGGLLAQFVHRLTMQSHTFQPSDGPRLGAVAQDLLSALLAHELDADEALPAETSRRTLVLCIKSFIQQHLADPQLSPGAIAAAHHISVSHLHRLFRGADTTVAAWIRSRRLERARDDLANPALQQVPVAHIGARAGFHQPATFSRAFRAVHGLTPGDYRHHMLSPLVAPAGDGASRQVASGSQ